MRYVLDSDLLSLYQRGDELLKRHLSKVPSEHAAISIISVEELLRGRLAQVRRAKHAHERVQAYYWLSKTLDFLCNFPVLQYDSRAEAYFQLFRE